MDDGTLSFIVSRIGVLGLTGTVAALSFLHCRAIELEKTAVVSSTLDAYRYYWKLAARVDIRDICNSHEELYGQYPCLRSELNTYYIR